MIATHVGLRASRDALFLSEFELDRLPLMVLGASFFSLCVLPWSTGAMARWTPARAVPAGFALSGVLLVVGGALAGRWPGAVAVCLYLQIAALGAFLVSGFWSVVNERFDPRSARREMGRIAAGAALGGLLGGLAIERMGARLELLALLPVLGGFHLATALLVWLLGAGAGERARPGSEPTRPGRLQGLQVLGRAPYLRRIALLVLVTTCAEILIDYVFKYRALAVYDDTSELVRFFALFYAAVGVGTFLLQTLAGRLMLERVGLAGTVAVLPVAAGLGSGALLALPGLAVASMVRGLESATRSSLFRSGYELLYTPVGVADKRASKAFVDVGVDKLGDGLGAALVSLLLLLPLAGAIPAMLVAAIILSLVALWTAASLRTGYVAALRGRLVEGADDLAIAPGNDTALVGTVSRLDLGRVLGRVPAPARNRAEEAAALARPADPIVRSLGDLRSGEPELVRARLAEGVDPLLARQVVLLLAWDEVARDAMRALSSLGPAIVGVLVDALLDRNSDFVVRRRVPAVLAAIPSQRSVEGLLEGLQDPQFEVRFRCGSALVRLNRDGSALTIPEDAVREAVSRELRGGPGSWRARRLRDPSDEGDSHVPWRRDPSLEHVFRLLGLVFEREPLEIAFRGLHTDDSQLEGTALEYLESILPLSIWTELSPFLEQQGREKRTGPRASAGDARSKLLLSQTSIDIRLTRQGSSEDGDSSQPDAPPRAP
jgi:hypothetical protein